MSTLAQETLMPTRISRTASRRSGFKDLLIVLVWSAIGLGAAAALCWFGLGWALALS
jgi:hypothetical protein